MFVCAKRFRENMKSGTRIVSKTDCWTWTFARFHDILYVLVYLVTAKHFRAMTFVSPLSVPFVRISPALSLFRLYWLNGRTHEKCNKHLTLCAFSWSRFHSIASIYFECVLVRVYARTVLRFFSSSSTKHLYVQFWPTKKGNKKDVDLYVLYHNI